MYYRQDLARAENKAKLAECKAELAEHKAELITRLFDVIFQSEYEQCRKALKPISKAILKKVEE